MPAGQCFPHRVLDQIPGLIRVASQRRRVPDQAGDLIFKEKMKIKHFALPYRGDAPFDEVSLFGICNRLMYGQPLFGNKL
jgi:hypothetical protein